MIAPALALPDGVLVFVRSAEGNDALAWVDIHGRSVTESQLTILKVAECTPTTPAQPPNPAHHQLVQHSIALIAQEERAIGGGLGRPSSARARVYERLMRYAERVRGTIFD